jgi:serine/threonine-protein kinase
MSTLLERVRNALAPRYDVNRQIGRGAMATVFYAADRELDREVAIKVLRPEFAAAVEVERFHREIRFLATLQHPNILPVLDSGVSKRLLFFSMPFAAGPTLRQRMDECGPLPIDEACRVIEEIAAAMDHAHERNIIHRDIKPENIVFHEDQTLVCDFGVGRAVVTAGGERLSSSGLIIGTPDYMSPEQAKGELQIDGRVDIYALGCVAHEMLTGEPPFTGATPQAVIARHVSQPPRSLRLVRPEIPEAVEQAVKWALAKKPEARPQSAASMVAHFHSGPRAG